MTLSKSQNFLAKQFTASDYVSAGCISMWDALENAGFGEHHQQPFIKNLYGSYNFSKNIQANERTFQFLAQCDHGQMGVGQIDNGTFTLECAFIKSQGYTGVIQSRPYVNGSYYNALQYWSLGGVEFYQRARSFTMPDIVPDGELISITFTSDMSSKTIVIYFNGKLFTYIDYWPDDHVYSRFLTSIGVEHFNIRIYDRAISQSEVAFNYMVDKTRFENMMTRKGDHS